MTIKDKLEIFIITYNRKSFLEKTLKTILGNQSPIKDYDIKILDNNSDDGTGEMCQIFLKKHPDLSYIKNHRNIGLAGNICRAMELASKEYFWILCDNDELDFSVWNEVEEYINTGKDLIITSRSFIDTFKPKEEKRRLAFSLAMCMFVPAAIFKTKHLSPFIMIYAMNEICTILPHMPLVYEIYNNNGEIVTLSKSIVSWLPNQDYSDNYERINTKRVHYQYKNGIHDVALKYLNSIKIVNDEALKKQLIYVACSKNGFGWINFNFIIKLFFEKRKRILELLQIFNEVPKDLKKEFIKQFMLYKTRKYLKVLRKEKTANRKTWYLFGIKVLSIKRWKRKGDDNKR